MLSSYRHQLRRLVGGELPASVFSALDNPLEPAKLKAQLAGLMGQTDASAAATLIEHVRNALVSSIDSVFLLYAGTLAITLIVSLWLEELPLRSSDSACAP
jgi:hypothetical protein